MIDSVFAAARASVPQVFSGQTDEPTLQQRFAVAVPWLAKALLAEVDEGRRGKLVEEFINRLEIGWREAGAGDMGVGKRVRAMAGALNGRIQRYAPLLAAAEREKLAVALTEHGVEAAEALATALVAGGTAEKGSKTGQKRQKVVARGRRAG